MAKCPQITPSMERLLYSIYEGKKITLFQTLWKQHVRKHQSIYYSSKHKRYPPAEHCYSFSIKFVLYSL